jgi:hypothetical protein
VFPAFNAIGRINADLGELFAALGQGARTRALLDALESDSLALRASGGAGLHRLRAARALVKRRGRDAIAEFTQADAVDPCPVCALPARLRSGAMPMSSWRTP